MNVITEKVFWELVEKGEKPCAVASVYEYVMTDDGYLVPSNIYIQLPEVQAKLRGVR